MLLVGDVGRLSPELAASASGEASMGKSLRQRRTSAAIARNYFAGTHKVHRLPSYSGSSADSRSTLEHHERDMPSEGTRAALGQIRIGEVAVEQPDVFPLPADFIEVASTSALTTAEISEVAGHLATNQFIA